MNSKLTFKQQRFIEEYAIDCNATQAAIRAGYSAKWAAGNIARLLNNALIRKGIEAKQAKIAKALEKKAIITKQQMVETLSEVFKVCAQTVMAQHANGQPVVTESGVNATKTTDPYAVVAVGKLISDLLNYVKEEKKEADDGTGVMRVKDVQTEEEWLNDKS